MPRKIGDSHHGLTLFHSIEITTDLRSYFSFFLNNVSGTLLTLEIEASSSFSGSETITLSNIVATDASSVRITIDDVTLTVNDNTTGIQLVNADNADGEQIYNLQGQKVDGSYKGVVIRNGKKVVVK